MKKIYFRLLIYNLKFIANLNKIFKSRMDSQKYSEQSYEEFSQYPQEVEKESLQQLINKLDFNPSHQQVQKNCQKKQPLIQGDKFISEDGKNLYKAQNTKNEKIDRSRSKLFSPKLPKKSGHEYYQSENIAIAPSTLQQLNSNQFKSTSLEKKNCFKLGKRPIKSNLNYYRRSLHMVNQSSSINKKQSVNLFPRNKRRKLKTQTQINIHSSFNQESMKKYRQILTDLDLIKGQQKQNQDKSTNRKTLSTIKDTLADLYEKRNHYSRYGRRHSHFNSRNKITVDYLPQKSEQRVIVFIKTYVFSHLQSVSIQISLLNDSLLINCNLIGKVNQTLKLVLDSEKAQKLFKESFSDWEVVGKRISIQTTQSGIKYLRVLSLRQLIANLKSQLKEDSIQKIETQRKTKQLKKLKHKMKQQEFIRRNYFSFIDKNHSTIDHKSQNKIIPKNEPVFHTIDHVDSLSKLYIQSQIEKQKNNKRLIGNARKKLSKLTKNLDYLSPEMRNKVISIREEYLKNLAKQKDSKQSQQNQEFIKRLKKLFQRLSKPKQTLQPIEKKDQTIIFSPENIIHKRQFSWTKQRKTAKNESNQFNLQRQRIRNSQKLSRLNHFSTQLPIQLKTNNKKIFINKYQRKKSFREFVLKNESEKLTIQELRMRRGSKKNNWMNELEGEQKQCIKEQGQTNQMEISQREDIKQKELQKANENKEKRTVVFKKEVQEFQIENNEKQIIDLENQSQNDEKIYSEEEEINGVEIKDYQEVNNQQGIEVLDKKTQKIQEQNNFINEMNKQDCKQNQQPDQEYINIEKERKIDHKQNDIKENEVNHKKQVNQIEVNQDKNKQQQQIMEKKIYIQNHNFKNKQLVNEVKIEQSNKAQDKKVDQNVKQHNQKKQLQTTFKNVKDQKQLIDKREIIKPQQSLLNTKQLCQKNISQQVVISQKSEQQKLEKQQQKQKKQDKQLFLIDQQIHVNQTQLKQNKLNDAHKILNIYKDQKKLNQSQSQIKQDKTKGNSIERNEIETVHHQHQLYQQSIQNIQPKQNLQKSLQHPIESISKQQQQLSKNQSTQQKTQTIHNISVLSNRKKSNPQIIEHAHQQKISNSNLISSDSIQTPFSQVSNINKQLQNTSKDQPIKQSQQKSLSSNNQLQQLNNKLNLSKQNSQQVQKTSQQSQPVKQILNINLQSSKTHPNSLSQKSNQINQKSIQIVKEPKKSQSPRPIQVQTPKIDDQQIKNPPNNILQHQHKKDLFQQTQNQQSNRKQQNIRTSKSKSLLRQSNQQIFEKYQALEPQFNFNAKFILIQSHQITQFLSKFYQSFSSQEKQMLLYPQQEMQKIIKNNLSLNQIIHFFNCNSIGWYQKQKRKYLLLGSLQCVHLIAKKYGAIQIQTFHIFNKQSQPQKKYLTKYMKDFEKFGYLYQKKMKIEGFYEIKGIIKVPKQIIPKNFILSEKSLIVNSMVSINTPLSQPKVKSLPPQQKHNNIFWHLLGDCLTNELTHQDLKKYIISCQKQSIDVSLFTESLKKQEVFDHVSPYIISQQQNTAEFQMSFDLPYVQLGNQTFLSLQSKQYSLGPTNQKFYLAYNSSENKEDTEIKFDWKLLIFEAEKSIVKQNYLETHLTTKINEINSAKPEKDLRLMVPAFSVKSSLRMTEDDDFKKSFIHRSSILCDLLPSSISVSDSIPTDNRKIIELSEEHEEQGFVFCVCSCMGNKIEKVVAGSWIGYKDQIIYDQFS